MIRRVVLRLFFFKDRLRFERGRHIAQTRLITSLRRRDEVMDEKELESGIGAILRSSGLHLLEFSLSRHKGSVKVKAVIYSPEGTGTDECAKAYRLILPQIQLSLDIQNPDIEVSSPGIDRIIKSEKEWSAFVGKNIKILLRDSDEWTSGKLTAHSGNTIEFTRRSGSETIEIPSIAKARLDSSHKGE